MDQPNEVVNTTNGVILEGVKYLCDGVRDRLEVGIDGRSSLTGKSIRAAAKAETTPVTDVMIVAATGCYGFRWVRARVVAR